MPIGLAISDSGSGNGVATVSGAGGAEVVTVYASAWTGAMGSLTAVSQGTITGNGGLSVAPGYGNYAWQAIGPTNGASPIVFQNLANAADPVHLTILNAVKTRISGLGFSSWLPSSKIFVRWLQNGETIKINGTPSLYLLPVGAEKYDNLVLQQDDIGYPVGIVLVDSLNNDTAANLARDLNWRHLSQAALRWQRLPGAPMVWRSEIIPDAICNPDAFGKGYLVSQFLMWFYVREPRG